MALNQSITITSIITPTAPGDWHSLCIVIANERKLRFVVHKSAVWTALLHMVRKA